ncbi:MAG: hypothetical protein LBO79_02005 [Zoogloeaceae bacterium]|jgi:hypothetical protein|nr:hypothetical protein [Zoogloeaceae bacterium]
MKLDMRKIYTFHPVEPAPSPDDLPTGGDLYYECTECSGIVSSVPRIQSACQCGNLSGNGGVILVKDPAKVRVVRGKLK